MNYKLYKKQGDLITVSPAMNKTDMREKVLFMDNPEIEFIQWGKYVYTMLDLYTERSGTYYKDFYDFNLR